MKSAIVALSIVSLYSAAALAAEKIPNYLQEKLNNATMATSVQLEVNDTLEELASDKQYREKVVEVVEKDLKGWKRAAQVSANSAGGTSIAAGPVGVLTALYGKPWYQSGKFVVTDESISVGGLLSMVSGIGMLNGTAMLTSKENVKYLLNDSRADLYASGVSQALRNIFQLSAPQQASLKYALLEEVHRKIKAGEKTPVDLLAVLKNTKHSGKALLSEKELEVLANLQDELKKGSESKPMSDEEKVSLLLRANALLEVQADQKLKASKDFTPKGVDSRQAYIKAKAQVKANEELLGEIRRFYSSTSEGGEAGNNQPEGTGTGAAE